MSIIILLFGLSYQALMARIDRLESKIEAIQAEYRQIPEMRGQLVFLQRDVDRILESLKAP
jgi:tetrahydromethanopterin S-methyltransferase subunit G